MEELANLELTSSIIGVRAYGETEKELGEILEKLQEENEIEAYGRTGNTTITGITFGQVVEQNGIELEIGEEKAVEKTATFTSSDPSQDYYVQIRGKKYPIAKTNGVIKITKTEITTGTNASGIITNVYSDNEKYATVEKVSGTTDKIKITGVAKGEATITVEYTENIKTSFIVRVKGNVTVSTQVENISNSENVGTATTITNVPYAEGSEITLTATVTNSDYQFVGWYETIDNGEETQKSTSTSYDYEVPENATTVILKAKFEEKPQTLGTTANDSGVGYYIRKGEEYAIVFADRVAQAGKKVNWNSSTPSSISGGSTCTFPTLTDEQKAGFKTYRINGTYTDSKFGKKDVLEVVDDTGHDRFIALALTDYPSAGTTSTWYHAAYGYMSDYESTTSKEFLKGKANTESILKKGIAGGGTGGYGSLKSNDIWYKLMEGWTYAMKTSWTASGYNAVDGSSAWGKVKDGWFIPSFEEWSAFGWAMRNAKLKANTTSWSDLGLTGSYWSSSQSSRDKVWVASLKLGYVNEAKVEGTLHGVRLAITF